MIDYTAETHTYSIQNHTTHMLSILSSTSTSTRTNTTTTTTTTTTNRSFVKLNGSWIKKTSPMDSMFAWPCGWTANQYSFFEDFQCCEKVTCKSHGHFSFLLFDNSWRGYYDRITNEIYWWKYLARWLARFIRLCCTVRTVCSSSRALIFLQKCEKRRKKALRLYT